MPSCNPRVSGTYHAARPWVKVSGTWQGAQSGWVKVSGTWQEFFVNFTGLTNTYSTAGSFTETIPSGALAVTIEIGGSANGGGTGHAGGIGAAGGGGGGGSGGYCKTILTLTSADWGKTMAVFLATAPTACTVSSGTKTITTMTANGGVIGASTSTNVGGAGGAGGTASGGNTTNTTGNAGANGAGGVETGGAGGAGIVGVNLTGPTGGHGQNALTGGTLGSIVFKYT